ncbi:MAG: glycosyltransferase family 39 protein [Deltaproteobacteria bacterium]|nr:glycosyltransferase family 39 protein [Deltaproteobacteria bacterium]
MSRNLLLRRIAGAAAWLVAGVAVCVLCNPGLLDSKEAAAAEVARSIAVTAFGMAPGGVDMVPDAAGSLVRFEHPPLQLLCSALGIRLFGAHLWAARLIPGLLAVAAALALWAMLGRVARPRSGWYVAIVLLTMPAWVLQARTLMGDVVAVSAVAIAWAGLSIAAFDVGASARSRWAWLGVGIFALLAGGASRGLLSGVAVPSIAIGMGWWAARDKQSGLDRVSSAVGSVCLIAGLGAMALVIAKIFRASPGESSWVLGTVLHAPARSITFDQSVAVVAHALAPWSAVLPFAIARMLRSGQQDAQTAGWRGTVVAGLAVAMFAHGLLAPLAQDAPFVGIPMAAVAIAWALQGLELRRQGSSVALLGVGSLMAAALLRRDFTAIPETALRAFGTSGLTAWPESAAQARPIWTAGLIGFGLLAVVCAFADEDAPKLTDRAAWRDAFANWAGAATEKLTRGWFIAIAVAMVAGAGTLAAIRMRAPWLPSAQLRMIPLNAWWVLAVVPPALLITHRVLSRLWAKAATAWFGGDRGGLLVLGGGCLGLLMLAQGHLVLASSRSPSSALRRYAALRQPGDELAVLGVDPRAAVWSEVGPVTVHKDAEAASRWLASARAQEGARRFLAVDSTSLLAVNRMHREHEHARVNLPVLDARSPGVLLVASRLAPGESSHNPLDRVLLAEAPAPQRAIGVELDGKLEMLGVDLTDERGRATVAVVPGQEYRFTTYYRVLGPLSDGWKAFVHVDGHGRRHNADHELWGGQYGLSSWKKGDTVSESCELVLPASFSPGTYQLYVGLFSGDTRMAVTRGAKESDGRIAAATIHVM